MCLATFSPNEMEAFLLQILFLDGQQNGPNSYKQGVVASKYINTTPDFIGVLCTCYPHDVK